MKIHEYQAKEIFARYGIPVPEGQMVTEIAQARTFFEEKGGPVVVKAQIHAGGRGKGGGVKLTRSLEETEQAFNDIMGMTLVTHQTGPEGKVVQRVLIEKAANIDHEFYLGFVMDRETSRVAIIASFGKPILYIGFPTADDRCDTTTSTISALPSSSTVTELTPIMYRRMLFAVSMRALRMWSMFNCSATL